MPQVKKTLIYLLLCLTLAIQGCPSPSWSRRIRKIEKNPTNFTIHFNSGLGLGCLANKSWISSISVSRGLGVHETEIFDIARSRLLWKVVATSQKYEDGKVLCEFEYGKVPEGFSRVWLDTDKYGYYRGDTSVAQAVSSVVKMTEQSIIYQDASKNVSTLIPGEQIYVHISGDLGNELIEVTLPLNE